MNKTETKTKKTRTPGGKRVLKLGSLSLTTTAVVIAVIVVLNLFVSELPATVTKFDGSALGLYTVGEETETFLSGMDTDVHLYLLAERGMEDTTILTLLERYEAMNRHVKVETVDPATRPTFISQYTDETLSQNSVIVASDLRHTIVNYSDIYQTQYSEEDYYNYLYTGQMPTGTKYFAGELAFTSAIDYVTRADLPMLYSLTGHGETELSSTYQGYITSDNIGMASLSLLTVDAVPADCTAILIANPTSDINADEQAMLSAYLVEGGNIILITSYDHYTETGMPNLAALCEEMGLESVDGLVFESSRDRYNGYPYSLLPSIGSTGPMEGVDDVRYTLMNAAHGIITNGSGATVYPILTSSSQAYVKSLEKELTTFEKEDGDISGTCYLGIGVSGEADGARGDTYKFVWYSSPSIVDESTDQYVSGGNSTVFMASVGWMAENPVSLSILAKQLQVEALTLTAAQQTFWAAAVTVILPVAVLGVGFAVWCRRRKA